MKKKKYKIRKDRVLAVILVIGVLLGLFYFNTKKELQVVSVVSEIGDFEYVLESNATRIFKKYYKELERELEDSKINEKNYASLIAKLFVIDYYTLDNKITNKNIGGVQFIHPNLKDSFILEASNTIYKYVNSNLYGDRRQRLPEVNDVEISKVEDIRYENGIFKDDSGYEVIVKVGYVKDYDYPEEVIIKIIHENNKLVIVEIK